MNMKKIATIVLLAAAVAVVGVPAQAEARGGRFWPGFAVGSATGFVFGSAFAPGVYYPPAVYYPAPVYYAPAPICSTTYTPGYWATVPVTNGFGYVSYQHQYVPGGPRTVCR